MRARLLVVILALVGCTQHAPPEDAVVAQMRAGLERSLAAMGEPPMGAAALENLAARMTWQCDAHALARVRDGSVSARDLAARARASIRQIESHGQGIRAPAMLIWLTDHADALAPEQRLVLEASIEQAVAEEPKPGPPQP